MYQGEDRIKQEKKRPVVQSNEVFGRPTDILLKWKQDPVSHKYEVSPLDCLGMSEDKALKKARRKIKNKVGVLSKFDQ